MSDDGYISELIAQQLAAQGVASFRVKDGHVFIFKAEVLEKLLAAAQEKDGRAMIHVKAGASA